MRSRSKISKATREWIRAGRPDEQGAHTMWTVASYAGGHETETRRMTFGSAVDLRDSMRADGDMTAVVLQYFTSN